MNNFKNGSFEEPEDGELRIYDNEAYIVSDGEKFKFETSQNINVRDVLNSVRRFDEEMNPMQEQMNLLNSYQDFDLDGIAPEAQHQEQDVVSQILSNLQGIAYCDFKRDQSNSISGEGQQILKLI